MLRIAIRTTSTNLRRPPMRSFLSLLGRDREPIRSSLRSDCSPWHHPGPSVGLGGHRCELSVWQMRAEVMRTTRRLWSPPVASASWRRRPLRQLGLVSRRNGPLPCWRLRTTTTRVITLDTWSSCWCWDMNSMQVILSRRRPFLIHGATLGRVEGSPSRQYPVRKHLHSKLKVVDGKLSRGHQDGAIFRHTVQLQRPPVYENQLHDGERTCGWGRWIDCVGFLPTDIPMITFTVAPTCTDLRK